MIGKKESIMKKSLFIVALAMVSFAACQKEIVPSENGGSVSAETVFTLSAVHEGVTTRTTLDGTTVNWAAGDQIALIWNGGNAVSKGYDVTKENNFEFDTEPGEGNLFAVYPGDLSAVYDGSDFKVTIPAAQTGKFEDAAIEVAEVSEGASVAFKHLGSLLEVTVSDENVSKIVISAYGGEKLAGTVPVTFADGVPVAGDVTDGTSTVTLSVTGVGTYYASVLPGTYEQGFYVELRNNADQVIGNKIGGKTLTLSRRALMGLGTLGTSLGKFVTVSGGAEVKDGVTWETALDMDGFLGAIAAKNAAGTYYLAGGTYFLNGLKTIGAGSNISVYGGFDPLSSGTDLSQRNIGLYETAFDTKSESDKRLFFWNDANIISTFDGVSFQNASYSKATGSVMLLQNFSNIKFNKCTIKNNNNTFTSTDDGGNIRFVGVSSGTATFTDCTFSGNTGTKSGVFLVAGSGSPTLNLDNCKFLNNIVTSETSVLKLKKTVACTVNINSCYFEGNKSTRSVISYASGATKTNVYLNGCSFNNNETTDKLGSCITATGGNMAIFNSAFYNNAVTGGKNAAAATILASGGKLLLANSSINTSDSNASGITVGENTQVYFVNNTFVHTNVVDGSAAVRVQKTAAATSYGHNLYSSIVYNTGVTDYTHENSDYADAEATISQTWNADCYLVWDGTVPEGFSMASPSRVEEAINAFDTKAGTTFCSWLKSIKVSGGTAFDADIRGVRRSTPWWSGAYQK